LDVINEGLKRSRKDLLQDEYVVVPLALMLDFSEIACLFLLQLLADDGKSAGEEYGGTLTPG
jgi:hypothetical protein